MYPVEIFSNYKPEYKSDMDQSIVDVENINYWHPGIESEIESENNEDKNNED